MFLALTRASACFLISSRVSIWVSSSPDEPSSERSPGARAAWWPWRIMKKGWESCRTGDLIAEYGAVSSTLVIAQLVKSVPARSWAPSTPWKWLRTWKQGKTHIFSKRLEQTVDLLARSLDDCVDVVNDICIFWERMSKARSFLASTWFDSFACSLHKVKFVAKMLDAWSDVEKQL